MAELILVVEDEEYVRELVSHTLQGAGYKVHTAEDGESATHAVVERRPDLVVLDVRLPGIDGWEVCRQVRAVSDVPILFLTAADDEEDIVRGFRVGGDDYLTKPFSPAILSARVRALLKRSAGPTPPQVVYLRGLTIDLNAAEVLRGESSIRLTASEFRILSILARNIGQVMSGRDIVRLALGYELRDTEAVELVKVHVRHLRQKIEPEPERPRYVVTVRGLGYMLNRDELEKSQ